MNDWPIHKFLIICISLIVGFISSSYLDSININVPLVKEIIGFIIITFIPGFMILRILRIHDIGNIKSLLFSVGLSLSFFMILGSIINKIYPLFGLKPFTYTSISITLVCSLIALLVITFIIDRNYIPLTNEFNYKDFLNPTLILSILIPILGILGVNLVNLYDNNTLLMGVILLISLVPVLIFWKNISSKYYPIIIFTISLTLLYQVSLFSEYVVGTDIFTEVYFANLVLNNGIWSFNDKHLINAALSVVITPVIYGKICNIDPTWYFKLISPLFLSLVPLGAYHMYINALKVKLTEKEVFLAVFFIIAIWQFYNMLTGVGRQQLAELFYILILIILFDKSERNMSYDLIFLIFTSSLIFTHYSTANLVMIFFVIFIMLYYIFMKNKVRQIGLNYIIFFLILTLSWTMYIADGSVFNGIVILLNNISNSFLEFFEPSVNVAVNVISTSSSNLAHTIYRYIFYIMIILIAIGGINLLKELLIKTGRFNKLEIVNANIFKNLKVVQDKKIQVYELFAFSNFLVLGLYIITPLIGYQLGFDRVFQIATLVLAPYLIIGLKTLSNSLEFVKNKISKNKIKKLNFNKLSLQIFTIFLSIFFLFNVGFVFEAINDPLPNSVPLSLKNVNHPEDISKNNGTLYLKIKTINTGQFYAAKWFSENFDSGKWSYYTFGNPELFMQGIFTPKVNFVRLESISDIETKRGSGYFYQNSISKIMNLEVSKQFDGETITNMGEKDNNTLNKLDKIYSSVENDIYYYNT
ncbi:MAG: DUF2206 domain-containing protein [Methanobacteriaceae archaeon]|nr:DUF2206 domain-containing protein [Methanobacteriaceae archaeon]